MLYGLQCSVLTICGSAMRQVTCQQWTRTWLAWWLGGLLAWWAFWLGGLGGMCVPNGAKWATWSRIGRMQSRNGSSAGAKQKHSAEIAVRSQIGQPAKVNTERPRTGDANRTKDSPSPHCAAVVREKMPKPIMRAGVAWQVTRAEALRLHCGLRHLLLRGVGSGSIWTQQPCIRRKRAGTTHRTWLPF